MSVLSSYSPPARRAGVPQALPRSPWSEGCGSGLSRKEKDLRLHMTPFMNIRLAEKVPPKREMVKDQGPLSALVPGSGLHRSIPTLCRDLILFHKAVCWPHFYSFMPFFFFLLFRAAPVTYGCSQVRGQMGAPGIHHSHSNSGS